MRPSTSKAMKEKREQKLAAMKERGEAGAREPENEFMVTNSFDAPPQGVPRYRSVKMTVEDDNSANIPTKGSKKTGSTSALGQAHEGTGSSSARAGLKPLAPTTKTGSASKKDLVIQGSSNLPGAASGGSAQQPQPRQKKVGSSGRPGTAGYSKQASLPSRTGVRRPSDSGNKGLDDY